MSKMYRSAQGRVVDIERLRLANEEIIAVGNMKVNARGDQLGPGGQVLKTRNQVMKDYYNLNTPVSVGGRASPRADVLTAESDNDTALTDIDPQSSELDQEMSDITDEELIDQESTKSQTKKEK
jgi:hypothetical protein